MTMRGKRMGARLAAALGACVLASVAGCRAQQPWPLWESYAARFMDGQGRVLDHSAGDRTTSEGESYALLFALVANDRARFDKVLNWTEANLAQGDLTQHLPAWNWGKGADGGWHVLDPNSASDSDLWIAYALCEAGRLWHVDRYSRLGLALAGRIAREEVLLTPGGGATLLPGREGFHPTADTWYVNPSYLPPPVLAYLDRAAPQGPWKSVLEGLPGLLRGNGGFAMDWLRRDPGGLHPSGPPSDPQSAQAMAPALGSYDAIRVYLWLGMSDPQTPAVRDSLAALGGMAAYLRQNAGPPEKVDAGGRVVSASAPPGFMAAVIPFLHALGMPAQEKAERDRLAATRDVPSGLYGRNPVYYDQNLALFATAWSEGRLRFDPGGHLLVRWKSG
jgi:endoglucanase